MNPEDVPEELIDLAMTGAKPGCRGDAAFYLANVLPVYTERVLTAAADQLDAMPETDGAALQGPYWYRDGWKQATGMLRDWADYPPALAARIARGESR